MTIQRNDGHLKTSLLFGEKITKKHLDNMVSGSNRPVQKRFSCHSLQKITYNFIWFYDPTVMPVL